ncbi:zinc metalloprotease [Actinomadura sp. 9N407]|uniref:zinc metalloprotease n=1 Tax=Actinomadura sp. 9N407 TaxID=3375154 RepID=UPI003792BFA9
MKPFVAVTLIAALAPAAPAVPAAASAVPVSAPAAAPAAPDCPPAAARIRPGAPPHVRERNELTPAEATTVERELRSLLSGLGLFRPEAPAPRPPDRNPDRVNVPVYFHVLHDGPSGKVPDATVKRQIKVLNDAHAGKAGKGPGATTGFTFTLRGVTRTDNARWYSDPERHEATFKPKLRKGDARTLNLYSADMGEDLLGWSTFPWKYKAEPKMDGVIVHPGSLPGGTIEHFDRGHTATHEVGHWLGLYHTFQDGCGGHGDRVADTPPERDPSNGCPKGKDTCPSPGADPVHNYMDYSHDKCMNQFTAGQAARMHDTWTAYRAQSDAV